jgi:hypothetical protein
MSGKHSRPPVSAESFDAQFAYSLFMAEVHRRRPIQDKVDEYIEARRQDKKEWEKEEA